MTRSADDDHAVSFDETRAALKALDLESGVEDDVSSSSDALDEAEPVDALELEIAEYLDGELSGEARATFERRLASDGQLRRRVELEQKALAALDALVDESPNVDLTERTVDRLHRNTQTELKAFQASRQARRRYGRALQLAAILGALALGRVVFGFFFPDVARQRERDANVVERLVQLEAVGDFEYLEALTEANLFEEWRKTPVAAASQSETALGFDKRELPYSELVKDAAFYRLQRRFEALDRDSRRRWRELRRQIDASPRQARLLQTLDDYAGWLVVSTSATDRARLRAMPVASRLQEIRRRLDASQKFADYWRNYQPDPSANLPRRGGRSASFAPYAPPGATLRAILPESLRRENFQSVYNKYVAYRSQKQAVGDVSRSRHEEALEFLSDVETSELVSGFSQASQAELNALDPQQRASMMGLIVSLSFVENAARFVPTRPFQTFAPPQPAPFKRRGDSVQELADTLRAVDDATRDFVTSRPPYEARGLLMGLNWGVVTPRQLRDENALGGSGVSFPLSAPFGTGATFPGRGDYLGGFGGSRNDRPRPNGMENQERGP